PAAQRIVFRDGAEELWPLYRHTDAPAQTATGGGIGQARLTGQRTGSGSQFPGDAGRSARRPAQRLAATAVRTRTVFTKRLEQQSRAAAGYAQRDAFAQGG